MTQAQTANKATIRDAVEGNLRRSAILSHGAIGVLVGLVLGFVVLKVVGAVLGAAVLGAIAAVYGVASSRRVVESALGAVMARIDSREIGESDAPRLFNLLEGLCAVTGVSVPRVSVTRDRGINSLVAADPARELASELVVTTGFIELLERIEMEGVVAVGLARLRSGAAEAQTLVATLTISRPWYVTAGQLGSLDELVSDGQTIFDDDVKGAGITRYPPGLAAAFQRMLGTSTQVANFDPNLVGLWVANPRGEADVAANSADASISGSRVETPTDVRPPLHERLALLREI
ncbi:MAG: hypothetical protein RJB08_1300 [Actinomycetota bacterium]